MPDSLHHLAWAFAAGRIILGLAPFLAAGPLIRLLGFPPAHDNPSARLMARLFGVRDIGLGVLVIGCAADPTLLRAAVLFNLLHDLGDLVAAAIPLIRRQGIDRGALLTGTFALGGALAWTGLYLLLA